jgi:DNA-3-methyladenine glycosylase
VYLVYGLHQMLNIVTGDDGDAQAVLIRACEPVRGLPTIRRRRGGKDGPSLLTGPGKVAQALGIDTQWSHHELHRDGGLTLRDGPRPAALLVGSRVGIDYAEPAHRILPWRFAAADTPFVTHARTLRPDGDASYDAADGLATSDP